MPNTYICLRRQCISRENKKICTIQPEDIQPIRVWRNAQLTYLRQGNPIEVDEQVRYYRDNIWPTMEHERPNNILMSYFEDAQLIGYGGLVHISWEHKRAEVSFLLDPDRMLKDSVFLSDMISFFELVKVLAFNDLGLHRLQTETYATRYGYVNAYSRVGFKLDGVLRQHVLIGGIFVDSLIHSCLKTDSVG